MDKELRVIHEKCVRKPGFWRLDEEWMKKAVGMALNGQEGGLGICRDDTVMRACDAPPLPHAARRRLGRHQAANQITLVTSVS
jgi:hypothetical protein